MTVTKKTEYHVYENQIVDSKKFSTTWVFNGKINYREKYEVWFINLLALLQKEGKGFFSPGVGGGGEGQGHPWIP